MPSVNVYKAQGWRDAPVADVHIHIEGEIPSMPTLEQSERLFDQDADKLMHALDHLPGGTFDALLGKMLQKKASHFLVKF